MVHKIVFALIATDSIRQQVDFMINRERNLEPRQPALELIDHLQHVSLYSSILHLDVSHNVQGRVHEVDCPLGMGETDPVDRQFYPLARYQRDVQQVLSFTYPAAVTLQPGGT